MPAQTEAKQVRSAIPRNSLLEHLAMAERHIAQGTAIIEKQKLLILELERDGHDITRPLALLHQFEDLQELHLADRDRLVAELAEA